MVSSVATSQQGQPRKHETPPSATQHDSYKDNPLKIDTFRTPQTNAASPSPSTSSPFTSPSPVYVPYQRHSISTPTNSSSSSSATPTLRPIFKQSKSEPSFNSYQKQSQQLGKDGLPRRDSAKCLTFGQSLEKLVFFTTDSPVEICRSPRFILGDSNDDLVGLGGASVSGSGTKPGLLASPLLQAPAAMQQPENGKVIRKRSKKQQTKEGEVLRKSRTKKASSSASTAGDAITVQDVDGRRGVVHVDDEVIIYEDDEESSELSVSSSGPSLSDDDEEDDDVEIYYEVDELEEAGAENEVSDASDSSDEVHGGVWMKDRRRIMTTSASNASNVSMNASQQQQGGVGVVSHDESLYELLSSPSENWIPVRQASNHSVCWGINDSVCFLYVGGTST
jgi:hypothetical protein